MFYPQKIKSIKPNDLVLEVGPGSTPHCRSNEFLELSFDSDAIKVSQRGGVLKEPSFGARKLHFYDGGKFPFEDNYFDYVICTHVIEHVSDPEFFVRELMRVSGGRGYIEYPLIAYEYLYNFDVHLQFVKYDFIHGKLKYLPKRDTGLSQFSLVSDLLRRSLELGWGDLCVSNKAVFFEGIEFEQPFLAERAENLGEVMPHTSFLKRKSFLRRGITYFLDRVNL